MKWPWPEVRQLVRQIAVTEQTYYRWRNEYGGLSIDQARKLKKLELENAWQFKQQEGFVQMT